MQTKLKGSFEDNVMLSAIRKRGETATIVLFLTLSSCGEKAPDLSQKQNFENPVDAFLAKEAEDKAWKKEYALKRAFGLLLNAKGSGETGELDNAQTIFTREHELSRKLFFKELEKIAQEQGDIATANWIKQEYLDTTTSQ